jgi:hypothetical protein
MRGTLLISLTLLLLRALVVQTNHAMSGAHIYLFAGGVFVAYSALALPLRVGLAATLFGGFLCDATSPVAFGTHALFFALIHLVVFTLRDRFARDVRYVQVGIALVANLALFIALSFAAAGHNPVPASALPRLAVDLAWSESVIALAAPWFIAFQARTLDLGGAGELRSA